MTDRADLIARLRALARAEHDDLSIADEAADALSRPVTGEMVERAYQRNPAWWKFNTVGDVDPRATIRAILTAALSPPAAGHETYRGHDPAAGLPQPDAAGGVAVDIVFDGPPSHESGRFVEVESPPGTGIRWGEWVHRDDGYWVLRHDPAAREAAIRAEATAKERERAANIAEGWAADGEEDAGLRLVRMAACGIAAAIRGGSHD